MTVDTYKTLGQAVSNGGTIVDVYTVPSNTAAIISAFVIANRDSAEDATEILIRVAGAAVNAKQIIRQSMPIPGNGFVKMCEGITLGAGDVVSFGNANGTNLTFSVFGVEKTSITSMTPKVLGQAALAAATVTDVYTVPSLKSAVISSIILTYGGDVTLAAVRAAVSVGGGAIATKDYLVFDYVLGGSGTSNGVAGAANHLDLTVGATVAAGDIVRARADVTGVAVNVFGVEIS